MKYTLLSLLLLLLNEQAQQGQNVNETDKLTIEYIAHASFKISSGTKSILLDPYADKVWIGYNFPKTIKADAIFSTHPHYDHDGGIFLGMDPYWKDKIPFYTNPGDYELESFKVHGIKGKHCDPYGKEFQQKNTIWIIEVQGIRIAHLGDNGPLSDENIKALNNIDILMVPMDAEYHILKREELKTVLAQIQPKLIVPMHYRIPELEDLPDKPTDLGPVEPCLAGKENVIRLKSNKLTIAKKELPLKTHYMLFKHSSIVSK